METSMAPPPPAEPPVVEGGSLSTAERFFRDHQVWLEKCGYKLRDRYMPDWIPSWRGTDKFWTECPDGLSTYGWALDAVRIRDNADVVLKRLLRASYVTREDGSIDPTAKYEEVEIGTFFSSSPLAEDPRNHCVPILEVLDVPDMEDCWIIAMPLLRIFDSPRFDTIGEAVDFFGQIFEGLKFMHDHNVAHRDCTYNNIMMGASEMFPEGYHPRSIKLTQDLTHKANFYTRTQRPPKYYLIDFGLSRKYSTRDPAPLEPTIEGGDKTVPEFELYDECDPFPTDVYYLGNLIRSLFLEAGKYTPKLLGLEFMWPLVKEMVATDPSNRPTMDQVVTRFENIKADLSSWKLRSRVVEEKESLFSIHLIVGHWLRRVGYILRRRPAIPRYRDAR
ncbi:kinase-like domain-containing protein, partial [Mycena vitilis]